MTREKNFITLIVVIAAIIGIILFCDPYDASKQFELAEKYLKEEKPQKAIPWLQKSARKGKREAQYRLHQCYQQGT